MPPSRPADDRTRVSGAAASEEPVVVTPAMLRSWPLPLDTNGDKYSRGTVLIVGGSVRTPGAALLAGLAALRAGAGRLRIATSAPVATTLAIAVPEALVAGLPLSSSSRAIDPGAAIDELADLVEGANAVLVGPGLEDAEATTELLVRLLPQMEQEAVLVLDALALGCLHAIDRRVLAPFRGRVVLTPNEQELRRLAPSAPDDAALLERAQAAAHEFGAVVTVHGLVAAPDGRCWADGTGGIGLGTSGSGDVLAGLVVGAAGRCGDAAQAACWGSHLHGAAGDRLAGRVGRVGFLARELLDEAPRVLSELVG